MIKISFLFFFYSKLKSRKIEDEDEKHNFSLMCSVKIKKLSKIFFYIGFDANFEIIREEYTFFLKKNKTLAENRKKENQETTQTKD
jgi:hypothetical protein